ncbi:E3 ubiquitin-protein ligase RMND5A-like isoform X1 [Lytechinus variegatus]|uniref:E3 ubiquitin-protein ligase RMND5A-like isoform X1 n=1 Tax=Lytechinus variegatus TaxID=7654 RepID=UPI001BB1E7A2|nr:E3 ubiquitin-protein ligase RMND5A-like isoform X1 [Lytechinus variegatus]
MEACMNVEREADKVIGKFHGVLNHAERTLDELIENLASVQEELSKSPHDDQFNLFHNHLLSSSIKRVREITSRLSNEHKDIHSSVSKVGKSIDKNFVSELIDLNQDPTYGNEDRMKLLNTVIFEHFLRQGMLDIAENLSQESNLDVSDSAKEPFVEINRILAALQEKNLQPALQWAANHREQLRSQNSSLEFKLHRLHFIELIRQGPEKQIEALLYARHFSQFAGAHEKELQVLMGSFLYIRQGLEASPYARLLDPVNWLEICDVFTQDACSLLGLSIESPLTVGVSAGTIALPALQKIKQVMQQRQCHVMWTAKDELPIEVELEPRQRYHSIFACPILRQQASENNPPMRLACGHAISRDSLNKLINGNKIKCPYCPVESSPNDAKQLHL